MATVVGGAAATTSERGEVALSVLRATLDPRTFKSAPPSFSSRTSMIQSVEYNLNYEVGETYAGKEDVPMNSGLVMWFVTKGADSIVHCGIVPANSVSVHMEKGLEVWPLDGATGVSADPDKRFLSLNFIAPLALPYGGVGALAAPSQNIVRVSPELEKNFSKARLYGGVMKCITSTNTKEFANINSNGRFSVGAIQDTRDICQTLQGSTWTAFSSTNLVTSSVTSKEGIKSCTANNGIASIIGPDAAVTFTSPSHQNDDQLDGEFQAFDITASNKDIAMPFDVIGDVAFRTGKPVFTAWVSPWQITANVDATGTSTHTNIIVPPIDEMGCLDLDVCLRKVHLWRGPEPPTKNYGNSCAICIHASNIYATIGIQGQVVYNTEIESKTIVLSDTHQYAGEAHFEKLQVRPRMQVDNSTTSSQHQPGFTTVGKYIGTFVQCSIHYIHRPYALTEDSTTVSGSTNNSAARVIFHKDPMIKVRARTINGHGTCGPVRVLRYESLNVKDTLRLDAMANLQCIAQASLAPFTQGAMMLNPEAADFNMIPWLVQMYNSQTSLKRNWLLEDYKEMVMRVPELTSIEQVVSWSSRDAQLRAAGMAAGLFGDLGSLGGSLLGGYFGHSDLGSRVGGYLGGLADKAWGGSSAGSFGSGGAQMYTNRRERDEF